jgi:hypothetical protein
VMIVSDLTLTLHSQAVRDAGPSPVTLLHSRARRKNECAAGIPKEGWVRTK